MNREGIPRGGAEDERLWLRDQDAMRVRRWERGETSSIERSTSNVKGEPQESDRDRMGCEASGVRRGDTNTTGERRGRAAASGGTAVGGAPVGAVGSGEGEYV